jgi:hypothetical protein
MIGRFVPSAQFFGQSRLRSLPEFDAIGSDGPRVGYWAQTCRMGLAGAKFSHFTKTRAYSAVSLLLKKEAAR